MGASIVVDTLEAAAAPRVIEKTALRVRFLNSFLLLPISKAVHLLRAIGRGGRAEQGEYFFGETVLLREIVQHLQNRAQ